MNVSYIVHVVLLVALVAISVFMAYWAVRQFWRRRSGESRKKDGLMLLPVVLAGTGIMLWMYLKDSAKSDYALLFIPMPVIILRLAWVAGRPFTEADAVQNYAKNRGNCGRCEYDLTGNITGVCPECGWRIPTGELLAEDSDWAAWWRKWEIRYLRDWLWHLTSYFGFCAMLLALAGYYYWHDDLRAAILLGALGLNSGINGVRVAVYVVRMRRVQAPAMAQGQGDSRNDGSGD